MKNTYKIIALSFVLYLIFDFGIVFASYGNVLSVVEINSTTSNGPSLSDNEYYGNAIVNIGDLNGDGVTDIAIGAQYNDTGGSDRGAIYILYLNTDGSVNSTVEINDSTTNGPVLSDADLFGASIANIGDLNNDGVIDLAVGATGDDAGGSARGALHILFMNTDGSVDSTVEINSSTTNGPTLSNFDFFGKSVAGLGDLNGDSVEDIVVGARNDDEGGSNRGAVHILFMNTDGSVDSTVEINNSTTNGPTLSDLDNFGDSVANLGDLNGDSVVDIAVGATGDDEGGSGRGAVHILFMNTDGSVDSTVEINSSTVNGPTLSNVDLFGASVANIGDLNVDGVIDITVGATLDDEGGSGRGAVHVIFMNTDGSVDSTVEINSSTTNGPTLSDLDNFGSSVEGLGDLDGNGVIDIAVGATGDDEGGSSRGAVHILFLAPPDSTPPTITSLTTTLADGTYGLNTAIPVTFNFSEVVTSTGSVSVSFDSGGSCTFTVSSATSASCTYTVAAGDSTKDLSATTISGTINDANSNAMTNFTPTSNLSNSHNITVDAPTGVRQSSGGRSSRSSSRSSTTSSGNDNTTTTEETTTTPTNTTTLNSSTGTGKVISNLVTSILNPSTSPESKSLFIKMLLKVLEGLR